MSAPLQQLLALAESGRAAEAAAQLETLAASGDAGAQFALGLWLVEGRYVARDLVRARRLVEAAAGQGLMPAGRAWAAFLAIGVGAEPDWQGAVALLETQAGSDPLARQQLDLIGAMDLTPEGDPRRWPEAEPLCVSPEMKRVPGLFSAAECAFLIEAAAGRLKPAAIFHEGEGRFVRDPVRDSDAAGFPIVLEWPAVHALNRRIAAASGTDVRQGEPLQVLRYRPGQQYRLHFDAVPGLANQRHLTMLIYLNDDYAGGETGFPEAAIEVKGKAGDGLLFRNDLADGRPDPTSRHAGLPVRAGEKLVASRWIRARPAAPGEGFGQHEVAAPLSPSGKAGQ